MARDDEERFAAGETLNQIDGVGSWAGEGVSYEVTLLPGHSVMCPACEGTGDSPETMICCLCGGDGVLAYDDYDR